MKDKLIEYREVFVRNTIWELLKRIAGFLASTIIPGFAANVISAYYPFLSKYRIPIVIFVILLSAWGSLELFTRLSRNIPHLPPVDSKYMILERRIRFEYGKAVCKYNLKTKIIVCQNGVDRLCGKYTWTGSEKPKLNSGKTVHTLIELVRRDTYIEYELLFNQSYKKGKTVDCEIYGNFQDSQGSFVPFFNSIVREPTNKLIITICIPSQYGVKEVILEEIAGTRNSNSESNIAKLDANGEYSWIVRSPKLFYHYTTRWQFPEGESSSIDS